VEARLDKHGRLLTAAGWLEGGIATYRLSCVATRRPSCECDAHCCFWRGGKCDSVLSIGVAMDRLACVRRGVESAARRGWPEGGGREAVSEVCSMY